jgi:hypothetical protein
MNAYKHSMKKRNELLHWYEGLVKKEEDCDTAQVLNVIFNKKLA